MAIKEVQDEIIKLFKNNVPVKEIAKMYEKSVSTIYYILNSNDIPIIAKDSLNSTLMEQLTKESNKGASLKKLSEKYNIEITLLCRLLNSYNPSDTIKQTIINLRLSGQQPYIIAQRLSMTIESVRKILREYNIQKALK